MSKKEASVEELHDLAHALACCSRNQGNGCMRECPLHGEEHCLGVLFGACAEAVDELIERREEEAGYIVRRLHLIRQPRPAPSPQGEFSEEQYKKELRNERETDPVQYRDGTGDPGRTEDTDPAACDTKIP